MGDLSYMNELPQMYHHCQNEDPDMDLGDFVFEHLLNINDGDECEKGERPHQPVYHHSPVQVMATVQYYHIFPSKNFQNATVLPVYPIFKDTRALISFGATVFHPPIV
jgi:hypothetical protein